MSNAKLWGWSAYQEDSWQQAPPGSLAARVTSRYQSHWTVMIPNGPRECTARLAGALEYLIAGPEDYPVTGDWVAVSPDGQLILQVVPRRTVITRQPAGRAARAQVLAANIDHVLLVFSPDGKRNFSIGLLERFLTLAAFGGVHPVVVLNKADTGTPEQIGMICHQIAGIDQNLAILVTSTITGTGLTALRHLLLPGETACLLGRSGVGKSSIINTMLNKPQQQTAAVRRSEAKGRHTTTATQLLRLPPAPGSGSECGGMLIDTPGLRELQLWGDETSLEQSFADITELAADCRFTDCRHQGEPGCAVQAAAAEGILPQQRLEHYLEQRKELTEAALRHRMGADAYEKQKWQQIAKDIRRMRKR